MSRLMSLFSLVIIYHPHFLPSASGLNPATDNDFWIHLNKANVDFPHSLSSASSYSKLYIKVITTIIIILSQSLEYICSEMGAS